MFMVINPSGGASGAGAAGYSITLDAKYNTYQASMEAYAFSNALTNPTTGNVSDAFWGLDLTGRASQNTYYDTNAALVVSTSNNTTVITRYSSTAQFTSNITTMLSATLKFMNGQNTGSDITTGGALIEVNNTENDAVAFSFVPANTWSQDIDYTTNFADQNIKTSATAVATSSGNKFLCTTNSSGQLVIFPIDSNYKITGAATDTKTVGNANNSDTHARVVAARGVYIWVAACSAFNTGAVRNADIYLRLYSISNLGILTLVDTVSGISTNAGGGSVITRGLDIHFIDDGGTDVFCAVSAYVEYSAGAYNYYRAAYKIDTSVVASVSETVLASENAVAAGNSGTWLHGKTTVNSMVCMVEAAEFYFHQFKVSTAGGAVSAGDVTMLGNTGFSWSSTAARRTYNTQSGNQTTVNCKDKTLTIPSTDGLNIHYVRDDDAVKEFVMVANNACTNAFINVSGELTYQLSTQLQVNTVNQGSAQVYTYWNLTTTATQAQIAPVGSVGITAQSVALSNIAIAAKYVEVTAISTATLTETAITYDGTVTNKVENKFVFDANGGTYATPTKSANKISTMLLNF